MKSEKGITLTSLVIYITIFMIIIAIMATITDYFYKNIYGIKEPLKYVSEFNKFSMFFINDVKNNKNVTTITDNSVTFEDGTAYKYRNQKIYRNDKVIAKNIRKLRFSSTNSITGNKEMIHVSVVLGEYSDETVRDIDFVLKYW